MLDVLIGLVLGAVAVLAGSWVGGRFDHWLDKYR